LPKPTKEPPIAALPFSLTLESSMPSFPAAPVLPAMSQLAVPVISLSPPTPQKNDSSTGIPNFFANSSLLTRPSFPPPLPPSSRNLFGQPPVKETSHPTPLVTPDEAPLSVGAKCFVTTSDPPETIQSIFPPPAPPVSTTPIISSPPILVSLTPSVKVEPIPEPAPAPFGGDQPKASFPPPVLPPSTQPPSSLFGGGPTNVSTTTDPSAASTMGPTPAATNSGQKEPMPSMFSFSGSSGTPFTGFGATTSTENPKPLTVEQSTLTPSPGEPAKTPIVAQSEGPKETKPGFPFAFKFGAASNSPEKPATPQFGGPSQGTTGSGGFTFTTSSDTADTQKPLFGSFPRPVTPPREEEEVRMEESPTRVVDVTTSRPSEGSFFGGRVLNFGQGNGNTSSPFDFGTAPGDSNPFGGKLEKPKSSSGFTFGSPGPGFGQPNPAFTFGKVDDTPQPVTPSSPFTFGTSKLPETNSFSVSQTTNSAPFNFGQRPGSSQDPPGFSFGQQQSPVTTSGPFSFGQGQTLAPPPVSFGQQNGSVPSSPSTFTQPLPFGLGSATPTSTSNPFNFQSSSPITTTPSSAPGFTFGQQPPTQAQPSTPVTPFPVPGSPQPAGGSLFNIGASPIVQSPTTRAIKKLPNRRGGARR